MTGHDAAEPGRRAAQDEKLDAAHRLLTTAVEALVTGQDWRHALEFAARFRSRSFSNTLLIYAQHHDAYTKGLVPDPTPTLVAGYRQWQTLGRQVRRSTHGYAILAPVTWRYASPTPTSPSTLWRRLGPGKSPHPGEVLHTRMVGARVAHVWDVSATDGDPLPELPHPQLLNGQAPAGLWDGLAAQLTDRGFGLLTVPDAAVLGGANGLTNYRDRTVQVRTDVDDASACRTLVHELAHVMLHGPENADATSHRGVAEVEAESVALMVFAAHGIDSSTYTVPYVSTWASTVDGTAPLTVVVSTAERARKTSLSILEHLKTPILPDGTPPGLHHATGTPARTPAARSAVDEPGTCAEPVATSEGVTL